MRSVKLPDGFAISGASLLDTGKVDFHWVVKGEREGSQNTKGVSGEAPSSMALFRACRVQILSAGRSALQLIKEDRSVVPMRSKGTLASSKVVADDLASFGIAMLRARVARTSAIGVPRASGSSKVI